MYLNRISEELKEPRKVKEMQGKKFNKLPTKVERNKCFSDELKKT